MQVDPAPLIEKLLPRLEWQGDCLVALIRGETRTHAYGVTAHEGRTYKATRFIWASVHGWDSIEGLVMRHTCDNRPCCNIDHLIPGTKRDNSRDMVERGRVGRPWSLTPVGPNQKRSNRAQSI